MLSAASVSLTFGGQQVLQDVSLTLDRTTRAGLVGANGSGKTTLLRILSGASTPEGGSVSVSRATTVAYLPQHIALSPGKSVRLVADEGYQREHNLAQERSELADRLIESPEDHSLLDSMARIDESLENSGYHTRHVQVNRVLRGLGFPDDALDQPVETLSGGWAMRVVLARTLLARPDFLLLDEPTNYLDSESRLWLSRFLAGFPGGYLLVSHDRVFLDETTTEILELFQGSIKRYRGSFSEYERRRKEELENLIKRWEEQQREIARQEQFIRRFRAQANKARQVQSRIRMLEKVDLLEIPEHLRPLSITLPPPPRAGRKVLTTESLSRGYGPRQVLRELSMEVEQGRRLAVVGRNGAGKSTLLRILAGRDQEHGGTLTIGKGVQCGYFAQDHPESLPTGKTVLSYLEEQAGDESRPRVRDILGAFLFSGDATEKPLEVLSGGERTRLAVASLLARPLNLLILDEPTNHLDMTSQEVLAQALRNYAGTVVFVSHDRSFLRSVATDVLALWPDESVVPRGWRLYPGSYAEFEGSHAGLLFAEPDENGTVGVDPPRQEKNMEGLRRYGDQKARRAEIRRLRQAEEELLLRIDGIDSECRQLEAELAQPEVYTRGDAVRQRSNRITQLKKESDRLHHQWEESVRRLEELDV